MEEAIFTPTRENASVTMEDLSSDLLTDYIFSYVGDKQYRYIALVNHTFNNAYIRKFPKKRTSKHTTNIATVERLKILIKEVGLIKSLKSIKALKDMVINIAAEYGNMIVVHMFHTYHPNITLIDTSKVFARAALNGHMKGIINLHTLLGPKWDHFTCSNAALNGHLDILKYVRNHGCPWDAWTCSNAALNGHNYVLRYAHDNGCPWTEHTCSNAALNGHLDSLDYAVNHGCKWNEFTCSNAAINGHLDILKYAHENGCPWNAYTCSNAAEHGHLHILKYAHDSGCPWTHHTVQNAIENGHLEIARWACRNGCHGSFLFPWGELDEDMDDDDDDDIDGDLDFMREHFLGGDFDGEDDVMRMARTIIRSMMQVQNHHH